MPENFSQFIKVPSTDSIAPPLEENHTQPLHNITAERRGGGLKAAGDGLASKEQVRLTAVFLTETKENRR